MWHAGRQRACARHARARVWALQQGFRAASRDALPCRSPARVQRRQRRARRRAARTGGVVVQANLQAEGGQLRGVGSRNAHIAGDGGVHDLARHALVALRARRGGREASMSVRPAQRETAARSSAWRQRVAGPGHACVQTLGHAPRARTATAHATGRHERAQRGSATRQQPLATTPRLGHARSGRPGGTWACCTCSCPGWSGGGARCAGKAGGTDQRAGEHVGGSCRRAARDAAAQRRRHATARRASEHARRVCCASICGRRRAAPAAPLRRSTARRAPVVRLALCEAQAGGARQRAFPACQRRRHLACKPLQHCAARFRASDAPRRRRYLTW